jgi:YegS/Rv2252/BmrU family lipid kinase
LIEKRKIRFIVNPFSGGKEKSELRSWIQALLDFNKYDYDYFVTSHPGHGKQLAREAVQQKLYMVVIAGGDGSVNEIGAELIHSNTMLGILPFGSGNGFAMHLGLGRNVKKAIQILNTGKSITIDSCSLNDMPFVNLAGVGFDAKVAYQTKKSKKRGFLLYFWSAIREAFSYKNKSYTLWTDGVSRDLKSFSITVANASMFGYNFVIAPKAFLTDGLLDVVIIKHVPKWRYILSVWRFLNKSIDKSRIFELIRAREVAIDSNDPIYYHMDGEGMKSTEKLNFKIHPLSLKILIPGDKAEHT